MMMNNLQKSAIANFISDPKLKLVKLNEQEYMEGHIAYRSQQNEPEMILKATFKVIEKHQSSQESYSILSIGCGSGLFEKPFLKKLIELNKSIHFVGIDPNKVECVKTEEWCHKLNRFQPDKFTFKIHPIKLEKFESSQSFDIILLIHSFYLFSEIESSFHKIYELLEEEGIVVIVIAIKTELRELLYYVTQRLYQRSILLSDDLYQFFSEHNISVHQEIIESPLNITKCFQKDSQLGKHLLDFIVGANTTYFSPSQLQVLLDYLSSNSQKLEGGEIMIPTSVSLYYFQKQKEEEIKKRN
ncbi:MAG: class I SAM-dependent methyltransferase [Okeania sp. SIO3B5]|uniref:class I SAM-dependent methyltransferase n=1 Tax=Okeania sp. SIO3B5 TaxID=2607811 RepID=UPI00140113B2|nr:class I SAM-dependent methyltransferase [Okeania sp. SIO3B5]NEO56872.1 class I SAM-dependent methyltransferase [Okeania sp. SIO3B5]